MQLHNFDNSIAYCEALGLSKVFKTYADECSREEIESIGFNSNSGYVYIALENGVSICSCLGQDIEFLVTDYMNGEEHFTEEYEEALKWIESGFQEEEEEEEE